MQRRYLLLSGVIAPVWFLLMTILGGALRPGYSHLADTVSELFAPGSPNKPLLDGLHAVFAMLLIGFGIGILQYVRASGRPARSAMAGARLYLAMGVLSLATATVFPQDAWGSPATFAGQMHKVLSGIIGLLGILSFILIGTWLDRAGIAAGFATYSWLTAGASVLAAVFFALNVGGPLMGLAERAAALAGFQWTFVVAFKMLTANSEPAHSP